MRHEQAPALSRLNLAFSSVFFNSALCLRSLALFIAFEGGNRQARSQVATNV
jgi:hypothetical protein